MPVLVGSRFIDGVVRDDSCTTGVCGACASILRGDECMLVGERGRWVSMALVQTACVIAPPPPEYNFNVRQPPLRAVHGSNTSAAGSTPEVLVGEAALKVCAIGTCLCTCVWMCVCVCVCVCT